MSDHAGYVVKLQLFSQLRHLDKLKGRDYEDAEAYRQEFGYVVFDEATPGGWTYARPGKTKPTEFPTEQEASSTISRLNARNRLRLEGGASIPQGMLLARAEVVSTAEMVAVEETNRELREERLAAKLEKVELKAKEAEAVAAKARAALQAAGGEVPKQSEATDWTAHGDTPGVQRRTRKDGQEVYRARFAGKQSESFSSVAEASAWRKLREEQAAHLAAVMADPEKAGLA